MIKSYNWTKVMKKSVVVLTALSICLGTEFAFPSKAAKAQTANYDLICSSTAYTADAGSLTASGRVVERNPRRISTVAVDPDVIPLGSILYIQGYGYAVAADTGGAIKGNKIDVFFDSESDCDDWGVKTVKVTVLGDSTNS